MTAASLLFGIGNISILKQSEMDFCFYIKGAGIMLSASVIMYLFHFFWHLDFKSVLPLYKTMAICFVVTAVWTTISWKCIIRK